MKAQADVMSPDTRLGMTSSHLNHQRQRVSQRQCFTSQRININCQRTNVNARCLDVPTYQSSKCWRQRSIPERIDKSINTLTLLVPGFAPPDFLKV